MRDTVDIIVITYYTGDILFECIKSLLLLNGLGKIILIDNGNSYEFCKRIWSVVQTTTAIQFVSGHGNIGFARACNLGARIAKSSFLLFLNPDCIVNDNNLLIKFMSIMAEYNVATCKILNKNGTVQKTCRRNLLTPLIAVSESLNLYKYCNKFKSLNLPVSDIDNLSDVTHVFALSGAVIFIKRDYFFLLGCFDESYFIHVEDMDLSMRIYLNGDKIGFIKNTDIMHALSTSETTSKFIELNKARGFIIYMEKFFPLFRYRICSVLLKSVIYLRFIIKLCFANIM